MDGSILIQNLHAMLMGSSDQPAAEPLQALVGPDLGRFEHFFGVVISLVHAFTITLGAVELLQKDCHVDAHDNHQINAVLFLAPDVIPFLDVVMENWCSGFHALLKFIRETPQGGDRHLQGR